MSDLWPHQEKAVNEVSATIASGLRRLVLSSPTGGGKTRIACSLIERWLDEGHKVAIYTRRKMLVDQLGKVLNARAIDFGTRAAGHLGDDFMPVQVCSMQTENARVFKSKEWAGLSDAMRVVVDEAHDCTGPVAAKILSHHAAEGAAIVGLSATPLGLSELYERLIQAGTNSELRACGALVPALHYAPDEPDMKQHKALQAGNLPTGPENQKIMRPQILFGSVLANMRKLNPELKPTILFASGVQESLWFAEELSKAGIPAAHLDGDSVWMDGKFYRADKKAREAVMNGSREGSVRVVCNRFVLREGVDAPWLVHGIFATVFGSLQSYLQSGGRLLRAFPSCTQVSIQDHGGNWWRHGSLNADRAWKLEWTGDIERGLREDAQRKGQPQPGRCPRCGLILFRPRCKCGWEAGTWKKSRPVMQTDGTLKEMGGDMFRPRTVCKRPDGPVAWERMYYRSNTVKGARTFRAAMALFAHERFLDQGFATWPDTSWPFMPLEPLDFFKLVADVPLERLIPKPEKVTT